MHLIAADIGNSRLKVGVLEIPEVRTDPVRIVYWEPQSLERPPNWEALLEHLPNQVKTASGIVAASNPARLDDVLGTWPASCPQPSLVRHATELPVVLDVAHPESVGIDRVLNALAANQLRSADQPAIVVDSGTATTIDCVSATGKFRGGAILPGIALSARALHEYTDQLPHLRIDELAGSPAAVGQETRSAIQSGLVWGQVGAIREIVERMGAELDSPPALYLTGGAADLLAEHIPHAIVREQMALEGLGWAARASGV